MLEDFAVIVGQCFAENMPAGHLYNGRRVYVRNQAIRRPFQEDFNGQAGIEPILGPMHVYPMGENFRWLDFEQDHIREQCRGKTGQGIYMGTAGLMSLNHLAASESQAAVLFDINPLQTVFWRHVLKALRSEATPAGFFDRLKDPDFENNLLQDLGSLTKTLKYGIYRNYGRTLKENIERLLSKEIDGTDWREEDSIYQENNYNHVRALAMRNAIAPVTMDLSDPAALFSVDAAVRKAGPHAYLACQYLSNIFEATGVPRGEHRGVRFAADGRTVIGDAQQKRVACLWEGAEKPVQDVIYAAHFLNAMMDPHKEGCRIHGYQMSRLIPVTQSAIAESRQWVQERNCLTVHGNRKSAAMCFN